MDPDANAALERLATLSLEKCLLRLSRVSAGTWQALEIKTFSGTPGDAVGRHDFKNPAAAVCLSLGSDPALTAMMLFDLADTKCVSECFTGHSFPGGGRTTPAEKVMLTELGNIVLNSLTSTFLNYLKKSAIPAVPHFTEGNLRSVAGELGKIVDLKENFSIIMIALAAQCGKSSARSEIFLLLPEELAAPLS